MRIVTKLAILFPFLLTFSCKKEDPLPVAPVITFMDAGIDQTGTSSMIKFEFIDSDGDIGLRQEENQGEQEFNVFVDYYEMIDGTWVLKSPILVWEPDIEHPDGGVWVETSTNLRVPYIENEAQRTLQGEIELDLLLNTRSLGLTPGPDTIKYDLYIKDRAFHKSNVITTTELIVDQY